MTRSDSPKRETSLVFFFAVPDSVSVLGQVLRAQLSPLSVVSFVAQFSVVSLLVGVLLVRAVLSSTSEAAPLRRTGLVDVVVEKGDRGHRINVCKLIHHDAATTSETLVVRVESKTQLDTLRTFPRATTLDSVCAALSLHKLFRGRERERGKRTKRRKRRSRKRLLGRAGVVALTR